MKLILLPVPDDPTVSLAWSFRVGAADDPPGKEGLASLTANLLTQGATEINSYESILEKLYPLAAGYEVTVDKELTTIRGRVHRDRLDEFVALMTDAVLRPAFRDEDFARLRSDALNFIRNTLRYSSDEELGKAALMAAAFSGTRYAHPVPGRIAALESLTVDDVRSFYRRHYTQARLTAGVAGSYTTPLLTRLEQALATLPPGEPDAAPPIDPPAAAGRRFVLVDKPGADASISFGAPLRVARGAREFSALALANSWLGEHRQSSGRLFRAIRGARGLNYGNYSYIEAFPDGGSRQMPPVNVPRRSRLFEIWIRTLPNDKATFALRCALRELDRVIADGLGREEFELTRRFLRNYSLLYAPTTAARLGYAIDDAFYGIGGDGHLASFRDHLDDLDLDEVNAAIRKHWQTETLTIAIVTGAADAVAAALAGGAPTPVAYPDPKPATVLAEDSEIAAWPLAINRPAIERWPAASLFD
jgi:zinc protease